eukprot:4956565-Heterocapsa_arctica.AAC.1
MYLLGLWKWQGTPELQWYGPSAVRPYSTEYIQERVRARGDRRLPVDMVIIDPGIGALARLRRGTVTG